MVTSDLSTSSSAGIGLEMKSKGVAKLDGRSDEVEIARLVVGDQAAHETAIQLELADGEIAQVGE